MFVAEDMYQLGSQRSAIRELFEYGKQRAAVVGAENVYDFSLGNPTVPAPDCVNETIRDHTNSIPFLCTDILLHREISRRDRQSQIT